jgi:hypothetical protein
MDPLFVFVKQHFFSTKLWIYKMWMKYDEKYDNAINCMKSRTPLLPNSWKLLNCWRIPCLYPRERRYELWTLISRVEMWLVLMVLTSNIESLSNDVIQFDILSDFCDGKPLLVWITIQSFNNNRYTKSLKN